VHGRDASGSIKRMKKRDYDLWSLNYHNHNCVISVFYTVSLNVLRN
jgi:hypothetical protein